MPPADEADEARVLRSEFDVGISPSEFFFRLVRDNRRTPAQRTKMSESLN